MTTTTTQHLVPVRRTHVLRHSPERVAAILESLHGRGVLLSRPDQITVQRHADGEVSVCFDVREYVPAPRVNPLLLAARRLWSRPVFRRFVYVAATLAGLFLTGHVTYLLFADEINAALLILAKLVGVALAVVFGAALLLRLLSGDSCPGVTNHCPPGFHR